MSGDFATLLTKIDGKGYSHYRKLRDVVADLGWAKLWFSRIQPDPYAKPSVLVARVRLKIPSTLLRYSVATADALARQLQLELKRFSRKLGEGHSGYLGLPKLAPVMIRRSCLEIHGSEAIVRLWVGLPSRSRRILGDVASRMLEDYIPTALYNALIKARINDVQRYVSAWIEQEYLRGIVLREDAVAFIGEGAILPRRCGICHEPLRGAKPFIPPSNTSIEIELPTGRIVKGMIIRRGLTVITGPAFHGKTTLIEAIAQGIYNHIPGDGRELVVSDPSTMLIRAEDGRHVTCVDISTFISSLPGGKNTRCFTTSDASGATSTTAAIQEAVEVGSQLLLIDEDYVAVNTLYYDDEAQRLVKRKTVTTIVEQARSMTKHVSLIIVSQGSAKLLKTADKVILMEDFEAHDVTQDANKLPIKPPRQQQYRRPRSRVLKEGPKLRKPRIKMGYLRAKQPPLEISIANPHIVEETQYNTIARLLTMVELFEGLSFNEIAHYVEKLLANGFDNIDPKPGPDYAWIRGIDFVYVINRLPGIHVEQT